MAWEKISGAARQATARFQKIWPGSFRRVRLYGVGMGKSGTHSLAGMFLKNVRVAHEAQSLELIEKILDRHDGRITEKELTEWVWARDRQLALEVDSSGLNFWIADILAREFPDARFVLTIRDCYSWTNSFLNHWLHHSQADANWIRFHDFRLGRKDVPYDPRERVLQEKGFHPLAAYLAHWTKHNSEAIAKIPAGRLLVVRTDQLRERALEIADFAGLPRASICLEKTHEFQNPAKQEIIRQIDGDFLECNVEQICGPLMRRFFPEIKSLADAKL